MKKTVLAALITVVGTVPAYASDWYLVGEVSHSTVDLDSSALDKVLSDNGATSLNSSDSGSGNQWRLQAGYRFNQNFALEAGYIDLGKNSYKGTYSGGRATADWSAGGIDIAAVGMLPVNSRFTLLGKVGAIGAQTKTDWSSNGISGIPDGNETKTQLKPFAGIGAAYNLNEKSDLRAEYERFNGIGDASLTGKADVSVISLGVTYHF